MIVLFQFKRPDNLPNFSPFCMKLECFLRMAGLEYRNEWITDPRKGPKGKAPWIELDGEIIGDSDLIIDRLVERYSIDVDGGLSPAERARGRAIAALLEDRLLYSALYSRWIDPAGAALIKKSFFRDMPRLVAPLAFAMIQRSQRSKLHQQGTGRHSHDEIYAMGEGDIDALAALLGDRKFVHGNEPHRTDCTVHAFVANLLRTPFDNRLTRRAATHANLVEYDRRMMRRFFPEYEEGRPANGTALDAA
ncbi:MAG: glutathione S-transferase family protein [Geminicoccaceae bacterium]